MGKCAKRTEFKITNKSSIIMDFLIELAIRQDKSPVSAHDLCKTIGTSYNYLNVLLVPLREAGIITSVKGSNGGFILSAKPSSITLLDVVDMIDGPAHLMLRLGKTQGKSNRLQSSWHDKDQAIRLMLKRITLQNVVDRYAEDTQGMNKQRKPATRKLQTC